MGTSPRRAAWLAAAVALVLAYENDPLRMIVTERGVAFRVSGARGRWVQVTHADGAHGWIHRELVWGEIQPAGTDR